MSLIFIPFLRLQPAKDALTCARTNSTVSAFTQGFITRRSPIIIFVSSDALLNILLYIRQDVAYFGVDMTKDPPEPKLTYYHCVEGECIKVPSFS